MKGIRILGRDVLGIDPEDVTLDIAADLLREFIPDIWRAVNVKYIEAPATHHGFKSIAVALASAIGETVIARRQLSPSNNIAAVAAVLERHNYPTYYLSAALFEALKRSSPPKDMTWAEVEMPFPGVVFMLPRGSLREPGGAEITFVGVVRCEADAVLTAPGTTFKISTRSEPSRASVFWSVGNSMVSQDCTFPVTQPLEPSPEWIASTTEHWKDFLPADEPTSVPAEFSSYVSGLVANMLLLKAARPTMVEPGGPTGRRLKSGVPIHRPTFIGRKYEAARRERAEAGGKFTELDWRCRHFRRQHHGPQGREVKIIWVEPYIAYVRGLVRKDPPEAPEAGEETP